MYMVRKLRRRTFLSLDSFNCSESSGAPIRNDLSTGKLGLGRSGSTGALWPSPADLEEGVLSAAPLAQVFEEGDFTKPRTFSIGMAKLRLCPPGIPPSSNPPACP